MGLSPKSNYEKKNRFLYDIGKVPSSPGKWNWNWLYFLPFIFTFEQGEMLKSVSLLSYLWLFSLNLAGFWFCSGFGSSLNSDILPNNQTSTFAAVRHLHKKCVERSLNLIKSSLVSWQGIRKKASKKILSSTTSEEKSNKLEQNLN